MLSHHPDVLLVIDSFEVGGTETFAVRALEALRADGVRVAVACLRPRGALLDRARSAACSFHDVSVPAGRLRVPRLVANLRSLIRELRPRTVYAQDVYSNYLAALACVGGREARVVTSRRWARTASLGRRILARWAAQRSDAVVANSDALSQVLASEGVARERIHILPNIIEASMFVRPTEDVRQRWREALGIPSGRSILMVAGRLHPDKGPDLALDAFSRLPEELRSNLMLVLMGDGVLRESLVERIGTYGLSAYVRMPGAFRTPPNVFGFADLAMLPSRTEGMPNALLEASAVACPVVASNVGGVRETAVELGKSILVVPPNDADALSDAIGRLVVRYAEVVAFAVDAQQRVLQRHAPDVVSRSLRQVLAVG